MGIYIEKKYQKTPLGAVVEDSMTSGSTVNAPSINAVQSAFSNPNLLINGDFQVWQRGTSFIEQIGTASQVFCADRWSTFGGIIAEKTENGIKVTGGEELLALNQRLEFKLKSDTTYTLSAKVNGVVYTKTFNGGNYFDESLFVHISWGDEFDAIGIYIPTNTTYEIEWVKLEKGSIATPFVPRPYAEELALCQRYYEKTEMDGCGTANYRHCDATRTSYDCGVWSFKETKRTSPTISIDGTPTYENCSNLQANSVNVDGCRLSVTTDASSKSYYRAYGQVFLIADAEIY